MNSIQFDEKLNKKEVAKALALENLGSITKVEEPHYKITNEIRFSDIIWDFRHRNTYHNSPYDYYYDFSEITSRTFRIFIKKMVLRELVYTKNAATTVKANYERTREFIFFLEKKYIDEPQYLYPKLIERFMETKPNILERSKPSIFNAIRKFLVEVEFHIPEFSISPYEPALNNYNRQMVKAETKGNKTPNIPRPLYNRIIKLALKDIEDTQLKFTQRMVACLILVISQVGMRNGEATILERSRLKEISILNGQKTSYLLEFLTFKTAGVETARFTESRATDLVVKAYNKLEELTADRRKILGSDYLYLNNSGKLYGKGAFSTHYNEFFIRHQKELSFETLNEYERTQIITQVIGKTDIWKHQQLKKSDFGKAYYKVNPHQFRVFVANELNNKGISLQWIRKHMNHLEEEMTKHYFRDDEKMKETLLFRASNDGTKLEEDPERVSEEAKKELDDPYFKEAYQTINKFLNKKKLNIHKNLDEIINILTSTPLNESEIGYCYNALGKLCERQERLATLEKWYYVRPQVVQLKSFDFTVKRFFDKAKIVDHNFKAYKENEKFNHQYKLEKVALEKFFVNKFYPEYQLFSKTIKEKGQQYLLDLYPNLSTVLSQIDSLEGKVNKWVSQLKLNQ